MKLESIPYLDSLKYVLERCGLGIDSSPEIDGCYVLFEDFNSSQIGFVWLSPLETILDFCFWHNETAPEIKGLLEIEYPNEVDGVSIQRNPRLPRYDILVIRWSPPFAPKRRGGKA